MTMPGLRLLIAMETSTFQGLKGNILLNYPTQINKSGNEDISLLG
jgi:hypothetical protein